MLACVARVRYGLGINTEGMMITLECMTGGWWRIEAANYAGAKFLMPLAERGAFSRVSFGDRGVMGSLAIKADRLAAFRKFAAERGIEIKG